MGNLFDALNPQAEWDHNWEKELEALIKEREEVNAILLKDRKSMLKFLIHKQLVGEFRAWESKEKE